MSGQGHKLHRRARHDALQVELERPEVLRKATFGGNADAVALDVNGPIGKVDFKRGSGRPDSRFERQGERCQREAELDAEYRVSAGNQLRCPARVRGLSGPRPAGRRDRGQADQGAEDRSGQLHGLTAQNPNSLLAAQVARPRLLHGEPGHSGHEFGNHDQGLHWQGPVTGNQLNTEIKTGFDYPSYLAGLQATRKAQPDRHGFASARRPGQQRGFRNPRPAKNTPGHYVYSSTTGTAGDGSVTGTSTAELGHGIAAASYSKSTLRGSAYNTGGRTGVG